MNQPVSHAPSRVKRIGVSTALSAVAIGYTVAAIGSLLMFKIPLSMTFMLMAFGLLMGLIIPYKIEPTFNHGRMSWRPMAVWLAGSAVIVLVISIFANENFQLWWLHPAGFQGTLMCIVFGITHFLHILTAHQNQRRNTDEQSDAFKPDLRGFPDG